MRSAAVPATPSAPVHATVRQQYLDLRASIHRKLLGRLNLEALAHVDRAKAEGEIRTLLAQLLTEENTPISLAERETLFAEVLDDVFGLGPLEPLLRDPSISDILVNTYRSVFVERRGVLERVTATFQDDAHLLRVIDRIVSRIGRRVDDSSPMVDARLADGSRVNAIIPPLAVDGPLLSIRRFPADRLKADDLVGLGALTKPMLDFSVALRARASQLHHQRRHGRREDHVAERAFELHLIARAHRHH
jgi:pilus assembly protein CpaF